MLKICVEFPLLYMFKYSFWEVLERPQKAAKGIPMCSVCLQQITIKPHKSQPPSSTINNYHRQSRYYYYFCLPYKCHLNASEHCLPDARLLSQSVRVHTLLRPPSSYQQMHIAHKFSHKTNKALHFCTNTHTRLL